MMLVMALVLVLITVLALVKAGGKCWGLRGRWLLVMALMVVFELLLATAMALTMVLGFAHTGGVWETVGGNG